MGADPFPRLALGGGNFIRTHFIGDLSSLGLPPDPSGSAMAGMRLFCEIF